MSIYTNSRQLRLRNTELHRQQKQERRQRLLLLKEFDDSKSNLWRRVVSRATSFIKPTGFIAHSTSIQIDSIPASVRLPSRSFFKEEYNRRNEYSGRFDSLENVSSARRPCINRESEWNLQIATDEGLLPRTSRSTRDCDSERKGTPYPN